MKILSSLILLGLGLGLSSAALAAATPTGNCTIGLMVYPQDSTGPNDHAMQIGPPVVTTDTIGSFNIYLQVPGVSQGQSVAAATPTKVDQLVTYTVPCSGSYYVHYTPASGEGHYMYTGSHSNGYSTSDAYPYIITFAESGAGIIIGYGQDDGSEWAPVGSR